MYGVRPKTPLRRPKRVRKRRPQRPNAIMVIVNYHLNRIHCRASTARGNLERDAWRPDDEDSRQIHARRAFASGGFPNGQSRHLARKVKKIYLTLV